MADPDGKTGASKELNDYWTVGEGRAKWANSEHPFRTLQTLLLQHMSLREASGLAARYYKIVFGRWPGGGKRKS
ncbi:hypothetical protein [Nocardia niwae]|uniref:hypothetical protein n=1 Tax=Nocardia niwae TaxID=626084 RepID=UPI0007A517CB|nr:hypothetical protein [Nocardia niwae]